VKNADGSLCLIGCAACDALYCKCLPLELKEHAPNSVRAESWGVVCLWCCVPVRCVLCGAIPHEDRSAAIELSYNPVPVTSVSR
jgi:hypothetical protein